MNNNLDKINSIATKVYEIQHKLSEKFKLLTDLQDDIARDIDSLKILKKELDREILQ